MPVERINFNNVVISAEKGYQAKKSKGISFKNVKLLLPQGKVEVINEVMETIE